jgi:hypothetical protein
MRHRPIALAAPPHGNQLDETCEPGELLEARSDPCLEKQQKLAATYVELACELLHEHGWIAPQPKHSLLYDGIAGFHSERQVIAIKIDNVKVTHAIVVILWCLDHVGSARGQRAHGQRPSRIHKCRHCISWRMRPMRPGERSEAND